MTRTLSIWRPDPTTSGGVSPDESLPRLSVQEAARVADYLDSGTVIARTTALLADPWSKSAAPQVPTSIRTDGEFRWDDAVSYYVRRYGLSPGDTFLTYVRNLGFEPRTPSPSEIECAIDELMGAPCQPQTEWRLDGSVLLAAGTYCVYQDQVFAYDFAYDVAGGKGVRMSVPPGAAIPAGFEPKDDRGSFRQAIAYKSVPFAEVESFYRVLTSCQYKGTPFSIAKIDGIQLRISIGGGRRISTLNPAPPRPTREEWGRFPNVEVLGVGEIWADIDIVEAAEITMAVVEIDLSSGYPVPVHNPTGYGYAVPAADSIFYFPSPASSPYLPLKDATDRITAYLTAHDPACPTTDLTPHRLRDGWRFSTTVETLTVYAIDDDGRIAAFPSTTPASYLDSRLSSEYRSLHPTIDPLPHIDSGTEIFD